MSGTGSRMMVVAVVLASNAAVAAAQPGSAETASEEHERAEAAYDTQFIAFEDEYGVEVVVHGYGNTAMGQARYTRNAVPLRGVQRERLSPVEFYDAVGQPSLGSAYRSRSRRRTAVGAVSLGGLVTSGVLAGFAIAALPGIEFDHCDVFAPGYQACLAAYQVAEDRRVADANTRVRNYGIAAGVTLLGSLVVAGIYRSMDPHPVSESARRLMAHDHNERLRRELGLRRRRAEVSLRPYVLGDGAGVIAAGQF